jgi:hypothetical protein
MGLAHPRETVKANRKTAYFWNVRHQNLLEMMCELEHVDWDVITSHEKTVDEMDSRFYEIICPFQNKISKRTYIAWFSIGLLQLVKN